MAIYLIHQYKIQFARWVSDSSCRKAKDDAFLRQVLTNQDM